MSKPVVKSSLLHLCVEEENLAAIPFAVLERRVGKRIGKIEIQGTKVLPDGTEVRVLWQVQGNNELGLPTEQDLDIFVALGVLTFRNNMSKTVTFTGREIAKVLGIQSVHGKFYQRLKVAMDRFIPLRFRGIAASDKQEEIKWLNVFQEASFSVDRESGRCMGSVTWTDKLINSMDSGFFRVLDASRYMELDGITGKHLYRFLAVAFERTDFIIINARKLAVEHLGIMNPPKYLSRLLQTLEPAFDQLIRIRVLGSYHVVNSDTWDLALHRHNSYVPERKTLLLHDEAASVELSRVWCQKALERCGFSERAAASYCENARQKIDLYQLERGSRLAEAFLAEGVSAPVALSVIRRAFDAGLGSEATTDMLDWCEIAVEICRRKCESGQNVKNPAGLLVRIARDAEGRERIVTNDMATAAKARFRQREQAILMQQQQAEHRALMLEYEQFREQLGIKLFEQLPEPKRQAIRKEKTEMLRQQDRLDRMDTSTREMEIDNLIRHDLVRREAPPFEKWYLRKQARQAVLPFSSETAPAIESTL
jgi:hypothetical protein